jgi:uncharacterized protein (TIGR02444 family)
LKARGNPVKVDREHAWQTIVSWYGEPGAADALLLEQQCTGLDVVLHLFFRYVEHEMKIALNADERADAQQAIAVWRDRVIVRVRELRREIKTMQGLDAIDDSRNDWREQLKAMEVRAERVEFMSLCAWLDRRLETRST